MTPARRLHPQVRGFDRAAERYERGRPDYPRPATAFLARQLGLRPGRTVVELGSGTGKLTRILRASGAAVVAVEPLAGMRRVFARRVPGILVVDGTAEAIPLPDGFADAVVAAQAFHWFRTRPALREIRRVLRPAGALGLVWNIRRPSTWLDRRLHTLLEGCAVGVPRARGTGWRKAFEGGVAGFGPLRRRRFEFAQRVDAAALVDRVLSVSAVATLPAARQRAVAAQVREIASREKVAPRHRGVRIHYRTDVYVARRRSDERGAPASDASQIGDHRQPAHLRGEGSARPS